MLEYREEIDGLRAIAVMAVVLFHSGFNTYFAGGYIGVDIFFVISGYLITSLIDHDSENNRFSLKQFYERRCRRILPMLFFIIFITSFVASFYLDATNLLKLGQTLLSIVTMSVNFFLWWTDDGYFNKPAESNPLVHIWSLAVEEQFYLFFPLIYSIMVYNKRRLTITFAFIGCMSLLLAQWGGNLDPIQSGKFYMFAQHRLATFYLPFGRIWEFLLGSSVVLCLNKGIREKISKRSREVLASIGLFFIVLSIYKLDHAQIYPFPNVYTLLPTIGTFLILVSGQKDTLVGSLLSITVLRWIGLISYSLYLWHQPVITFIKMSNIQLMEWHTTVLVLAGLLLLSTLSFHFIERPFRRKDFLSTSKVFLISSIATLATLMLVLFIFRIPQERLTVKVPPPNVGVTDRLEYKLTKNVCVTVRIPRHECQKFTKTSVRKLAVIGDSFTEDLLNMIFLGGHLKSFEIRAYYLKHACQIYVGPEDRLQFIPPSFHADCRKGNSVLNAMHLIRRADVIIFTSHWVAWSSVRLPKTVKLLNLTSSQRIFVMGSKDIRPFDQRSFENRSDEYRKNPTAQFSPWVVDINNIIRKDFGNSIFVDYEKFLCKGANNTCDIFTPAGEFIFEDGAHLTKAGARYLGDLMFESPPLDVLKSTNNT